MVIFYKNYYTHPNKKQRLEIRREHGEFGGQTKLSNSIQGNMLNQYGYHISESIQIYGYPKAFGYIAIRNLQKTVFDI